MRVQNKNKSSIKTTKKIKEAFAELMKEKQSISNMTVTELVYLADITRSSFYTHYESIYDVAEDIQNDTLEFLKFNESEILSLEDIDKYLDDVVNHLKENELMYKMILSSREPLLFMDKLNKLISSRIKEVLKESTPSDMDLDLTVSFFTDGCINLFIKFFRGELDTSLEEINAYMKRLAALIFQETAKNSKK